MKSFSTIYEGPVFNLILKKLTSRMYKTLFCGHLNTSINYVSKAAWVVLQFLQGKHFFLPGAVKKLPGDMVKVTRVIFF